MTTTYTGHITINGGNRLEGVTARTHNAALRRTRRLLSGQGYRAVPAESYAGHLTLRAPSGDTAIIDIAQARRIERR